MDDLLYVCIMILLFDMIPSYLTQDSTDIGCLTEMFPNVPMDVIESSLDGHSLQEAVCILVDDQDQPNLMSSESTSSK